MPKMNSGNAMPACLPPLPISETANTSSAMQSPGGITYHQAPALGAPELNAFSSIVPQEMLVGSPSPRNASDASARIATAMIRTVLA